jgi:uncharacterized protein Yka (UPF0111/DUF47 family)
MTFLKKLMGYDDKFFGLLESSAKEAQSSVQLLVQLLAQGQGNLNSLDEFVLTRRKDKKITENITEELCRTFVTPLDREDIERLSFALYKIPKTVEKFSEKYLLCKDKIAHLDFSRQLDILQKSVDTVFLMVSKLRVKAHLEQMKEHNDKLHYLEGEADKLMLGIMRSLYSDEKNPLTIIISLDLYEELERIVDRCRDAGNVVFQIVLKYS